MMRGMERAILRTLCYHDIFDYPLLSSEVWRFLITRRKTKERDIQKTLRLMKADRKQIEANRDCYYLRGRKEIVSLRKRREKYSRKKLLIAKKVAKFLRWVPAIKMIGMTGAVSIGNAEKNDDIDLLIITSSGRLWLTRILAVLLMEVLGKRRRPTDKKVADKICLNIFLDENHLKMPKGKRNLFVAHEIEQMKVLYQKDNVYQKFLKENRWVRRYLANSVNTRQVTRDKKKEKRILLHLLDFFEKFAYRLQLKYMKSKMTKEQVSLHFAFFHPEDVGERVMRKYRQKYEKIYGEDAFML